MRVSGDKVRVRVLLSVAIVGLVCLFGYLAAVYHTAPAAAEQPTAKVETSQQPVSFFSSYYPPAEGQTTAPNTVAPSSPSMLSEPCPAEPRLGSPPPSLPPPPANSVPQKALENENIDKLIAVLDEIKTKRGELDKREKETVEVLKRKLKEQGEHLRRLGVASEEPLAARKPTTTEATCKPGTTACPHPAPPPNKPQGTTAPVSSRLSPSTVPVPWPHPEKRAE
jgi:hypothetical protein